MVIRDISIVLCSLSEWMSFPLGTRAPLTMSPLQAALNHVDTSVCRTNFILITFICNVYVTYGF